MYPHETPRFRLVYDIIVRNKGYAFQVVYDIWKQLIKKWLLTIHLNADLNFTKPGLTKCKSTHKTIFEEPFSRFQKHFSNSKTYLEDSNMEVLGTS